MKLENSIAAGFEVAVHVDWGQLELLLPFEPMRPERQSASRGIQS